MKKGMIALFVVILASIVVVGVLALRKNTTNTSPTNTANTNQAGDGTSTPEHNATMDNNNSQQSSNQTAQAVNKVSIENFAFTPANITVKKGTTVTWTNNDSASHSVVSDTTTGPNSAVLGNGKSYSYTFSEAGEFTYKCGLHPSMTAKVIVTE